MLGKVTKMHFKVCEKYLQVKALEKPFLLLLFVHVEKKLDQKDNIDFENHDVTTWEANNCNSHVVKYFEK